MPDAVVKAKILRGSAFEDVCIGIDGGRVSAVEDYLDATIIHDYGHCLALPGGVDVHTHMREPGMTQKEDFDTGTRSAVFGGTTTVIDMPNTDPEVTTLAILKEKIELLKDKANADFGLMASLSKPDEIAKMAPHAIGFKLYMSETTGTGGTAAVSELMASPGLEGKVVTVHAESPLMFQDIGCTGLRTHNVIRNMESEVAAVEDILETPTRANVNLAHLTSPESVALARKKAVGFEVTPHHILLDDNADIGSMGKVNPPLRHPRVAATLFGELKAGHVPIVASDHAPHTLEEKARSFDRAPSGMPGVETRLPLLMALAVNGALSYETVRDTCCTHPAKLYGLNKGVISEGYDADLAIFDLDKMTTIRGRDLHSKCGWSAFENHEAIFPVATFLRGERIVSDGKLTKARFGRPL